MRICSLLIALLFCLSGCVHRNNHNLKITMEESNGNYTFSASFPDDKTAAVHRAVNKSMSPAGLFASVNDYLDVTTTMPDNTSFAVKASPGIICIKANRQENSPASYNKVKDMCMAIKKVLKD